jgi:hypothetical protein
MRAAAVSKGWAGEGRVRQRQWVVGGLDRSRSAMQALTEWSKNADTLSQTFRGESKLAKLAVRVSESGSAKRATMAGARACVGWLAMKSMRGTAAAINTCGDARTVKVDDDSSVEEVVVVSRNVKLEGPIDPPDDGVVHGDALCTRCGVVDGSPANIEVVRFGVKKFWTACVRFAVVAVVAAAVFRQDAPFDVNEGGARENVQHHDTLPFQ